MRHGRSVFIICLFAVVALCTSLVLAWPMLEVRFGTDEYLLAKLEKSQDTMSDAKFSIYCLKIGNKNIRAAALSSTTGFESPETKNFIKQNAAAILRRCLKDSDPSIRSIALEVCAHFSQLNMGDVDDGLNDPDEFVRATVCDLIYLESLPHSEEKLWHIARTDSYDPASRAVRALSKQGADALMILATEKGARPNRDGFVANCLRLLSDDQYLMMISRHKEWVKTRYAVLTCIDSISYKSHLLIKVKPYLHEIAKFDPKANELLRDMLRSIYDK